MGRGASDSTTATVKAPASIAAFQSMGFASEDAKSGSVYPIIISDDCQAGNSAKKL